MPERDERESSLDLKLKPGEDRETQQNYSANHIEAEYKLQAQVSELFKSQIIRFKAIGSELSSKAINESSSLKAAKAGEDKAKAEYEGLSGQKVTFDKQSWRILSADALADKIVLIAGGARVQNVDSVRSLNPGRELKIGETFKIRRSNGDIDDAWKFTGYKDPDKQKEALFFKVHACQTSVTMEQLRKENEHVLAAVKPEPKENAINPQKASESLQEIRDKGPLKGRQIIFEGRKWLIADASYGIATLTRPVKMKPADC